MAYLQSGKAMNKHFDVIIIGAGIVGLGCALAAVNRGKKVAIIERNAKAVGASIRNFGFVTVTGQRAGAHYNRAKRSRDIWAEIAPNAGIDVLHKGLVLPAYREEARDVVAAFLKTDMGADCRLLTKTEAQAQIASLKLSGDEAILYSPHELRVESMTAIPKLAHWLHEAKGVDFFWKTAALGIIDNRVKTSRGNFYGNTIIVCPGDDFSSLYPERIAPHALSICTLQMLRVAPNGAANLSNNNTCRFNAALMSDHSLARYEGFSALPQAVALGARLDRDYPLKRQLGIHLIAVQSADGSLVVGDSHIYGNAPETFAKTAIDDLMMECLDEIIDLPKREIINHWIGTYAASKTKTVLVDSPQDHVRLVMVTGGTGASTAFALGEEVIDDLF